MHRRRGFVLLAVLSVVTGAVALGLLILREAQGIVRTASNRADFTRARWRALDCIERTRASLDDEVASYQVIGEPWSNLDIFVQRAWLVTQARGCSLTATALGDRVDANSADRAALKRFLGALAIHAPSADSLVDALLDWRDEDHDPRPMGAEAESYDATRELTPRNGPLVSPGEIAHVRGFRMRPTVTQLLGTEAARISLAHAPRAVLMSLPGFSHELADEILRLRSRGSLPADLSQLAGGLSDSARDSLIVRRPELASLVTVQPDGWVLQSRGRMAGSQVTAVVEVTLTRVGTGTQILRHREWWE